MILSELELLDVIRLTPLVVIALIVTDGHRRILVGKRRNRPARDTWGVPEGRVRKNETLDVAFTRIVNAELGITSVQRSAARFYGVFEQQYDENFAGEPGISTHYIALAYTMTISATVAIGRFDQHCEYAWLLPADLLNHDGVHETTKDFFR